MSDPLGRKDRVLWIGGPSQAVVGIRHADLLVGMEQGRETSASMEQGFLLVVDDAKEIDALAATSVVQPRRYRWR
ncbi:MAG: hypothetical protein ABGX16_01840 [Pirellulales bacterium]